MRISRNILQIPRKQIVLYLPKHKYSEAKGLKDRAYTLWPAHFFRKVLVILCNENKIE
jgi:hypothetical protein